jgi:hypothetical protein
MPPSSPNDSSRRRVFKSQSSIRRYNARYEAKLLVDDVYQTKSTVVVQKWPMAVHMAHVPTNYEFGNGELVNQRRRSFECCYYF